MPDQSQRWTEIELLPAWEEKYYNVYTAKKLGKWVMLKTLKPEYRDDPAMQEMLNKEFDARYNLAHPNIVMINDFEDVPGVGRSIITDDVYGKTLRTLMDSGELTDKHYEQLCQRLPMALEYIQQNHLAHHDLRPETVIFTDQIGNLKMIDVGYEQQSALSHADTSNDIRNYGNLMLEVLQKTGRRDPHMEAVARRAARGEFHDVQSMRMAIDGRGDRRLWMLVAGVSVVVAAILATLLLTGNG